MALTLATSLLNLHADQTDAKNTRIANIKVTNKATMYHAGKSDMTKEPVEAIAPTPATINCCVSRFIPLPIREDIALANCFLQT